MLLHVLFFSFTLSHHFIVNLYDHVPLVCCYMYCFLIYLITPLYCIMFKNVYAHAPSVHYCMYVCYIVVL